MLGFSTKAFSIALDQGFNSGRRSMRCILAWISGYNLMRRDSFD